MCRQMAVENQYRSDHCDSPEIKFRFREGIRVRVPLDFHAPESTIHELIDNVALHMTSVTVFGPIKPEILSE